MPLEIMQNMVVDGEIVCKGRNELALLHQKNVGGHVCGNVLTHSHTMTPFDTPGKQAF